MTTVPRKPFAAAVLLMGALVAGVQLLGCHSPNLSARSLPTDMLAPSGAGKQQLRLRGMALAGGASTSVGPADQLEVMILTGLADENAQPHSIRVGDNGAVEIPYVGSVQVAGLEPTEVASRISAAAVERGIYRRPQVNVTVTEQASYRVTVLGAVSKPGVQDVPRRGCDVMTAIAAAGGFTEDAGTVVEVLRHDTSGMIANGESTAPNASGVQQVVFNAPGAPSPEATESFDLSKLDAIPADRQRLSDRDVVVVRKREQRLVHVTGLVAKPNQFELTEDHDLRLLDAIALAGGTTSKVADKVILIRRSPAGAESVAIDASISGAKKNSAENLVLQAGDLVSVETTAATTVVDAVNTFFRVSLGLGGNLSLF